MINSGSQGLVEPNNVYCLSIDIIGSTAFGLELPTIQNDRFNTSLVKQIKPHLEKLELNEALIKFTGDGWLVMTHDVGKIHALCHLAIVMAYIFREEISKHTGIQKNLIPSLRLAICSGRDIPVELPDGRKDWVGDSARRATRSSGYCLPNEILIDVPIYNHIMRDFFVERLNPEQRPLEYRPKRMEEHMELYILGELKTNDGSEIYEIINRKKRLQRRVQSWNDLIAHLPDYSSALKMFETLEFSELSPDVMTYNALINKAPDYNERKIWVDKMVAIGIQPNVVTYNTLINKAPDYNEGKIWVDKMITKEIQLDIITYNTLIKKSPDYDEAMIWIDMMEEKNMFPNVVTYSMLINKAPDYNEGKIWVDKMVANGCSPNFVTYNTLIKKSPDYNEGKIWVDKMITEGIQPDTVTYSTLFSKNISDKSADDILKWYLTQKNHPENPIQIAITSYLKAGCIDQAFYLVLNYPHLKAARKLIRAHPEGVIQYIKNIFDVNPQHQNASYALGIALLELGKEEEAELYLNKALRLSTAPLRKAKIRDCLLQIDYKNSISDQQK